MVISAFIGLVGLGPASRVFVGNRGVGNLRLIGLVGLGPASRVFTCSLLDRLLQLQPHIPKCPIWPRIPTVFTFHLLDSLLTTTTNIPVCPIWPRIPTHLPNNHHSARTWSSPVETPKAAKWSTRNARSLRKVGDTPLSGGRTMGRLGLDHSIPYISNCNRIMWSSIRPCDYLKRVTTYNDSAGVQPSKTYSHDMHPFFYDDSPQSWCRMPATHLEGSKDTMGF